MKNVVLIGMPGTGKSTVGVVLAKKLGYDFLDTDILLSKVEGKTLPEIIDEKGYQGFLRAEGNVGANLTCEKTVIATGGSMALVDCAMENLKKIGKIVWLDTPISVLKKRLKKNINSRGVATENPMTVEEIYNHRKNSYEKYADITVNCEGDIDDVINELLKKM